MFFSGSMDLDKLLILDEAEGVKTLWFHLLELLIHVDSIQLDGISQGWFLPRFVLGRNKTWKSLMSQHRLQSILWFLCFFNISS